MNILELMVMIIIDIFKYLLSWNGLLEKNLLELSHRSIINFSL